MRVMTYTNQRYFIGAGCGTIFSSLDGMDWKMSVMNSDATINGIVWNGHEYIAVGGIYTHGMIFKSANGQQWKPLYEKNGDITVLTVKKSRTSI